MLTIEATRHVLTVDWLKRGGPQVSEPARQGFGARLLVDWRPDGMHIRCVVPLPADKPTP